MGVVVLLAQAAGLAALLRHSASVGRMPLTNYLMQSVIATTLFYGYAFGLYYRIGPAVGVLIASDLRRAGGLLQPGGWPGSGSVRWSGSSRHP